MKINAKPGHVLAAAAVLLLPTSALAQTTTDNVTVDTGIEEPVERDDDDDFPWGLLGLLGLAGLLGRKKRDDDIRVDARRDTRP